MVILNNICEYKAKHNMRRYYVYICMNTLMIRQLKKLLHFAAQIFTELCFKGLSDKRE